MTQELRKRSEITSKVNLCCAMKQYFHMSLKKALTLTDVLTYSATSHLHMLTDIYRTLTKKQGPTLFSNLQSKTMWEKIF